MADQQQPQKQEMNVLRADGLNLPPGFRFHPSDVEIISHYLMNKVHNKDFTCIAIGEADINKSEPWDLRDKAKWGEKEWYFFYQKDRKYPSGLRANRATKAGYWKATGKDKEVYKTTGGVELLVGMKKTLVFYNGRAPKGNKTNWVMHEYRLEGTGKLLDPTSASSSTAVATAMKASTSGSKFVQDEWVVCRVFEKTTGIKNTTAAAYHVPMAGDETDQNQSNIPSIPIHMPPQLPLPVPMPMPMQLPNLPDYNMDSMAPYYPNVGSGMPGIMPTMAGISGTSGPEFNDAMFGNPVAALSRMNMYQQMGMGATVGQMGMGATVGQMEMEGAVAQMDMGAAGAGGFDVATLESRPPSNATEISPMMSMTGLGSTRTITEMDGIWKYKY